MASFFEDHIDERLKDPNFNPKRQQLLVFGYIHDWNKQKNAATIPETLIKTFNSFYPVDIKFHTKIHGGFTFSNNDTYATMPYPKFSASIYSTAMIDKIISAEMCKRFEIKYRFEIMENASAGLDGIGGHDGGFAIGYLPSSDLYNFHFNYAPLGEDNQQNCFDDNSVGIYFMPRGVWERRNHLKRLLVSDRAPLSDDDTFGLVFDFESDEMKIFHNDKYISSVTLDGSKSIVPAVCLPFYFAWIVISEWKLEMK